MGFGGNTQVLSKSYSRAPFTRKTERKRRGGEVHNFPGKLKCFQTWEKITERHIRQSWDIRRFSLTSDIKKAGGGNYEVFRM